MSTPPTIMLYVDGVWINALEVEVVKVDYGAGYTNITMKSGRIVRVGGTNDDKLIALIDHALLTVAGVIPALETKFKPSGD